MHEETVLYLEIHPTSFVLPVMNDGL